MPSADAWRRPISLAVVQEGERVMRICNACRYCEGFCAVFPAMERRLAFSEPDLDYLANLCHDCGECYHACQYAPPHEFAVNLPLALAEVRRETYRKYAWPGSLAGLFTRDRLTLLLSAAIVPALFALSLGLFAGRSALFSPHADREGSFYQVMPHTVMIGTFGSLGVLVSIALVAGPIRFWRETGETLASFLNPRAWGQALSDALTLRYLDGGGDGCASREDVPSHARRWYHHLTFYGFMLCGAATSVAAFYHNVLGWEAPYALFSVPVVLGCLGGAGLLIGPSGLLWLKIIRHPELNEPAQIRMDVAFLAMLFLTSLTGFLLLMLRESSAMGSLLAVHLGLVTGLFATLPYGKFVHGLYRFCALVRNALEKGRPPLSMGLAAAGVERQDHE